MNDAISASKLSFSYDKRPVLTENTFSIPAGQFIGLIGPNGGGKTTLLKLLLGFLTPSSGTIHLFGNSPETMRRKIGYVPQSNRTDRDFPLTLLELVMLGTLWNRPFYPPKAKEAALYWIEELGLTLHRNKPFASLSGGLAQRALLARALVSHPELLLLDEPTANVDPHSKELLLAKLRSFRGKKTILLVTHDLSSIAEGIDQIFCVEKTITPYRPEELCQHVALGLYPPVPKALPGAIHVP
ncbi:MAG: ATP-binding cassette domain-containing protein [Verrucomicrobiota bacterium]|nr:ATP-binding cassette domain-containing protein [Verrucomicrobiota bacterium]